MNDRIRAKRVLDIQVSSKITPKEVDALLRQIYDLAGCPACGFLGYDFSIRVLPADLELGRLEEMRQFDNVLNVDLRETVGF